MSTAPRAAQTTKGGRIFLALLAVFALPLLVAWVFTMGPLDWRPVKSVNHGVLLEPPLQLRSYGVMDAAGAALTVKAVARDWFLVVFHGTVCAESCQGLLRIAERIQIAVGRDTRRVTLALLGPDNDALVPRRQSWLLPEDGKLIRELRRAMGEPQLDTVLLIVDHQGRVILMYPPTEDGPGMLYDLKRLLRSSAR